MSNIDKLIINSPFNEPNKYWSYDATTKDFKLKDGRRPLVIGGKLKVK